MMLITQCKGDTHVWAAVNAQTEMAAEAQHVLWADIPHIPPYLCLSKWIKLGVKC